jgi:hypothetical protein
MNKQAPPAPQPWGEKHPWFLDSLGGKTTKSFVSTRFSKLLLVNDIIIGLFLPPELGGRGGLALTFNPTINTGNPTSLWG